MMVKELRRIDITNVPELLRLAEEMRKSREPWLLRRDSEDVAILMPVKLKRRTPRAKTNEDLAAFRSAAGGWKDVDTDRLLADIYADRRASDRPPVEL